MPENGTEQSGVILYTADGDPVQVTLMDEDDECLRLVEKLQEGVYGYANKGVSLTMFLKEPKVECVYCERPVGYGKIADHHMRVHPNERWNPAYYPEVYEQPNFAESPHGEDTGTDRIVAYEMEVTSRLSDGWSKHIIPVEDLPEPPEKAWRDDHDVRNVRPLMYADEGNGSTTETAQDGDSR